jgi:hypothetical protein
MIESYWDCGGTGVGLLSGSEAQPAISRQVSVERVCVKVVIIGYTIMKPDWPSAFCRSFKR